ncbi:MAG: DUF3618 domain-containing protein [Cytophagales bacterium]|nr:DUF3618 domain-containing protein [Armatimonadota bacterium]
MAQDQTRGTTEAISDDPVSAGSGSQSFRTYPFVADANYTNYEKQDDTVSTNNDPDKEIDLEEDATEEVRAARAEVEQTRAELSGTIDALKERLSPAALVAEAKDAAVDAAHTAATGAIGSAKEAASNAVETVKEAASNVVSSAKTVIGDALDTAKSAVSGAMHSAGDTAASAAHSVKEASQTVGGSAKGAGTTIVETIRLNPIPAAITGIGLGWLIMSIRRQNEQSVQYNGGVYNPTAPDRFVSATDQYGQNSFGTYGSPGSDRPSPVDTAREKLTEVRDTVTSRASDLASNVSDKAGDLAHTVSDRASTLAHTVGDRASAFGGQAKETAQSAASATGSYITNNPLAAGAIALMLGVGAGLLIPATERENQLLGETRDRLKDQAAEQLHQVADKVTNVAQTAFDGVKQTVKDEAQNQGLTGTPAPV